MDVLEAISGNRVNYAMNAIGGVNRDITDPKAIREAVGAIKAALARNIVPVFTENKTVRSRAAGVGPLTREDAIRYGAVGPIARASGLPVDGRQDFPYAAYGELGFQIVTQESCDVMARVIVRALEMLESVRLIEAALDNLPAGLIRIADRFPTILAGEAVMRAEAPRGEVLCYLLSDGTDTPKRVKVRTPSYLNIPTVQAMCVGQQLGDMPLIQASIDPCCSCTDR